MHRILILACVCAIASATPFNLAKYPSNLAWLFGFNKKAVDETKDVQEPCGTEECKSIAEVIIKSMDDSVDPCDDFYQYACGNWANNNDIPEGETSWDLWGMVQERITNFVIDILTSDAKPDDILAVKLGKKWYKVCMDTDKIEQAGLEPLLATMARMGGWPLIMDPDEWDDRVYHWQKVDEYYSRLAGINAFYDIQVIDFIPGNIRLAIDTPHLPPRSYRLWNGDDGDDGDDSNENESEEKNNNPGSEQEDDDEDDDKDDDNEEDEDENKVARHKKKLSKGKVTRKITHAKKRLNKSKVTKKQHDEKKSKRRIKRRVNVHSRKASHDEKQRKQKKVTKHVHHARKAAMKVPKHKRLSDDNEEDAPENTPEENDENKNEGTSDTDDDNKDNGNEEEEESEGKDEGEDEGEDKGEDADEDGDEEEGDDEEEEEEEEEDEDGSTEESAEEHRETYKKYIRGMAKALAEARGTEISEEKLTKDIEDLVAFQVKIIELSFKDSSYDNMTLTEFQEAYEANNPTSRGKVNWLRKIRRLFSEADIEITGDEMAFIACNEYMKGLASLLDETPAETIVNYVHWNFLSKAVMASTKKMREMFDSWETNGKPQEEDRKEDCAQQVQMHDIVAYEFVKKYFPDEIKTMALDMIDDIQKEVEYQIKAATWMDESTKDFILDKLVYMEKLVGYPDWYQNTTIVRRYFRGLSVGPSYYENVLSYIRYAKWKRLRRYVDEPEVEEWFMSPLTLNAFFMPNENSITVTAADFQSPFFAINRPQSLNYGIVGSVMAHEVNHGFDNDGHLYDRSGKVVEWMSAMAAAYNKRAECFVDQFNKYSVLESANLTIENYGNQTAGENIADTMGLQSVFRAYQRRQRECGKGEPPLPGLEKYTNEQIFFLSYANIWCEAIADPEEAALRAKFDVHSTGRLRVIGPVSNSEDFAKAFNCPEGSPMNPKKKCNIWK